MSDTSRFCSKCGNERVEGQSQRKEVVEDNRIRFLLKPEFQVLYQLLSNIGHALVYIFICFLFTRLYVLWFIYPSTLLITIAIMIIYVIGKLIFRRMQYDYLEYNFYSTKVQYKDGFINKEEKELKYKYIREVTMSQNILERFCGIGTIKIFTNASNGGYNGIYIHCVYNVQEQYMIIKEIIDTETSED